jgi:hypothetical protein
VKTARNANVETEGDALPVRPMELVQPRGRCAQGLAARLHVDAAVDDGNGTAPAVQD